MRSKARTPHKQVSRALVAQPRLAAVTPGGDDMANRTCSIEGCERPVQARGWCTTHYHRWWKHGDPTAVKRSRQGRADGEFVERSTLEERFWPKVAIPADPLACWEWMAAKDKRSGYGRMTV